MRALSSILVFSLLPATGALAADCSGNGYSSQVTGTDITNALLNGRVDATNPTTSENWKEDHCPSNALYKVGAGNNVDPYRQVGTYMIDESNNTVTYTYGTNSYEFTLYTDGTGFCWELGGDAKAIDTDGLAGVGGCS